MASKREKHASLPFYSPRPWHGMTPGVWFPLLRRNRFRVSPTLVPLTLAVSGYCWFNLLWRGVSETVYRHKIRHSTRQHPLIFVIGHWRTGTTLLHELLVRDKRFNFATTYQCMSPSHFLLTERLFLPLLRFLLPKTRPMDSMEVGADFPQEDEFALMNLGAGSPYQEWAFPNHARDISPFLTLDNVGSEAAEHWSAQFQWFVQRVIAKDNRQLLLKSPTHTARIDTILKLFPDSRFIHITRDPREFIPSTIRTWRRIMESVGLQVRQPRDLTGYIFEMYSQMYDKFERTRGLIKPANFADTRYENLIADPVIEIERIYEQLGIDGFAEVAPDIESAWSKRSDYTPSAYHLDADLKRRIEYECDDYIRSYDYMSPAHLAPRTARATART